MEHQAPPNYYMVARRTGYAIMRTGPRGGTKLIAMYEDKLVAQDVAANLNYHAREEVTA